MLEELILYKDALKRFSNPPSWSIIYVKDYYIYNGAENIKKHYADVYIADHSNKLAQQMKNKRLRLKFIDLLPKTQPLESASTNANFKLIPRRKNVKKLTANKKNKDEKSLYRLAFKEF